MDRRGFLGGLAFAGLVGLTGCTSSTPGPSPTGSGASPPPGDDDELRRVTFVAEQELVAHYAAAILGAGPELAELLRTIQVQHVEHARRLRPETPVSTDPPTPGATVTPSPTRQPVAVLTALRRAEEAALTQRSAACDRARDAGLARSLCLIAASEGQHVDQLRLWRSELTR